MSCEPVRVIVSGALGRMGRVVAEAIREVPDMELVAGVEAPERLSEDPGFPLLSSPSGAKASVLADFTRPEISLAILEEAARAGMGLVIGTTGFTDEQKEAIKKLAVDVPTVLSANMSLGINLMFGLVRDAASGLLGYDIEIIEIHHKHKRDAPSGTARALFETLRERRPGIRPVDKRAGAREPDEVGIFSLRGGEVFGEHSVLFMGDGEIVEITHRVLSRKCFAVGTLAAIRFVARAEPGLYSMKEVLGL